MAWGFCMALADSVPGVSGGTIAFLLGFYDTFLSSIDDLIRGNRAQRLNALKFLIPLGAGWAVGMMIAVIILTRIFESHIYAVSSLFFGLILFSVPLVIYEERQALKGHLRWFFFAPLGSVFVLFVSTASASPSSVTNLPYLFLGGIAAVSAMVLPGVSGSTLLLIMGLYLPVITAVRSVIGFDFSSLPAVLLFALGIVTGAVLVVRLLRFLMERFRPQMIFLILGLMLGSLYAVAQGPGTLEPPRDALALNNFDFLFFALGGVIIWGLQVPKLFSPRGGKEADNENSG